jgi:uncharacterized membrane protein
MSSVGLLLYGTIVDRPYVYAFFVCFLFFGIRHLRWKDCLIWFLLAYAIAFASEYSSTRDGFPFGIFRYFDEARARELWISNVPFWDPLSFVFLSYFCWVVAAAVRAPRDSQIRYQKRFQTVLLEPKTVLLSGLLMMCLDLVIDPLALRGDKWFLGKIYDYPEGGSYFGVTLANFAGWFFVGAVIPLTFSLLAQMHWVNPGNWRRLSPRQILIAFAVYCGVFVFNLGVTAWIQEWRLMIFSSIVTLLTVILCVRRLENINRA